MKNLIKTAAIISLFATPCFASDMKYPVNNIGFGQVLERQAIVVGNGNATFDAMALMWEDMQDNFKYIDDATNYGNWYQLKGARVDYWAAPAEFAKKGGGDCEDWAIAAYYKLREIGFKAEQLTIATGYLPKQNNENHAILLVEIDGFEFVLDQQRSTIALSDVYTSDIFEPHYYVNENGWRVYK